MTKKEIAALQLSLGKDGFAFCKQLKSGKLASIRKITDQEVTSMITMMYARHITEHPGERVMHLPIDNQGHALAVIFTQINKDNDKE